MAFSPIEIHDPENVFDLVQEVGFLPFFENRIPGFSIGEMTPASLWFTDVPGPWEWKGEIIRRGCAYGKFFRGKAGFISREWYTDFANYRRDGYDFDARYDDGLAKAEDKKVYDLLDGYDSLLSKEMKRMGGFSGKGNHFDASINRLQMQGYVLISDFEYAIDRYGNTYGWGIARYATPEKFFGPSFRSEVYRREPEESFHRMLEHFRGLFPQTQEGELRKMLG